MNAVLFLCPYLCQHSQLLLLEKRAPCDHHTFTYLHRRIFPFHMSVTTQNRATKSPSFPCQLAHLSHSLFSISYYSSQSNFADRCDSRLLRGGTNGKNKPASDLRSRMLNCLHKSQKPQPEPFCPQGNGSQTDIYPIILPSWVNGWPGSLPTYVPCDSRWLV